jgi:hypothetical protein
VQGEEYVDEAEEDDEDEVGVFVTLLKKLDSLGIGVVPNDL